MTAVQEESELRGHAVHAKPLVKYAGGKRQLLPEIMKHVPKSFRDSETATYYEPFVGGGAVFFELQPHRAVLGDANDRLIRSYLGVRNDVEAVIEVLSDMVDDAEEFQEQRQRIVEEMGEVDTAAWFIFLNRTGFNGLYRVNRAGKFNVPYDATRAHKRTICDAVNLRAVSKALANVGLRSGDFEKTLKSAEAGDLVYCDPPYIPVSKTADFTAYTSDGFTMSDQERLRDCARRLKDRGVHVLLSNADLPVVRDLYAGFMMRGVSARRSVNSNAEGRGPVGELLIW